VHVPVLAGPAITWLRVREDGVYVDCTAGAGGHAVLIAERLITGRLIALDRDPVAVKMAAEQLAPYGCATVLRRNYANLAAVLAELGVPEVQGVLLDAGVSTMQLDDAARGFSLEKDGPLDMRMDPTQGPTAAEFLATTDEERLARVLKQYGDLKRPRRIASAIIGRCREGRLETTRDLFEAVHAALPFVRGVPEETRLVFQAIRIAVNEELRWLESTLVQAIDRLAPGGRLVAISFHSGEDRLVKNAMRDAARVRREFRPDGRIASETPPRLRLLTPKPIRPTSEEIRMNPRARSAKLRAAERLAIPEAAP